MGLADEAVAGVFGTPSAKPAKVTAPDYVWMLHDLVLPEWVADLARQHEQYADYVRRVLVRDAPQPWGSAYRIAT